MYSVEYTDIALEDMRKLKRSEPRAFDKLRTLLIELMQHPHTGTGKPERLSGSRLGQWSRRITQKHRLVYTIEDYRVTVIVLSTYGHYDDK